MLSRSTRQVAHALLTRPPLIRGPKSPSPFDLNVLGTPPAFILSQDQTLDKWYLNLRRELKSIRRVLLLSLLFYLLLKELYEIVFHTQFKYFSLLLVLCTFSSVVQFSRTAATRFFGLHRPLARGGLSFYHNFRDLSIPFLKLFSFFSKSFSSSSLFAGSFRPQLSKRSTIIPKLWRKVNTFFESFFSLGLPRVLPNLWTRFLCIMHKKLDKSHLLRKSHLIFDLIYVIITPLYACIVKWI